jgi:maleylpyruvate isomerase
LSAVATIPEAPFEALGEVRQSETRMLDTIAPLDDAIMTRPSLLPGWTVAHLLTHLARNADSHWRRTQAAIQGVMVDQYPGGFEERNAEIEAGAGRPADALIADVGSATGRLLEAWSDVPAVAWANVTRDATGRERPLHELPTRRWLEVEVHLVDLGIGPTHREWPDEFVAAHLPEMRDGAAVRLASGDTLPAPGDLDPHDELAWLYGRFVRNGLPPLGPWP